MQMKIAKKKKKISEKGYAQIESKHRPWIFSCRSLYAMAIGKETNSSLLFLVQQL